MPYRPITSAALASKSGSRFGVTWFGCHTVFPSAANLQEIYGNPLPQFRRLLGGVLVQQGLHLQLGQRQGLGKGVRHALGHRHAALAQTALSQPDELVEIDVRAKFVDVASVTRSRCRSWAPVMVAAFALDSIGTWDRR